MGPDERARLYDELFEGGLFGLFRSTLDGRLISCNQRLAQLLGYADVEELVAQPVERLYFDMVERERYLEELTKHRRVSSYEILLKHKDGKAVHVLENTVLRQAKGGATVIEGAVIDITEVRRSELEQRVLVNNYRELTERILDGVMVVQKGKVVYANQAAKDLLNDPRLEHFEFLPQVCKDDQANVEAMLREVEAGGAPVSIRAKFKAGHVECRPLLLHAITSWHMNNVAVQLTLQDLESERAQMRERLQGSITEEMNAILRSEIEEHKRTQVELEQSRKLASSLIDSSLDMIIAVDQKGMITEFNPAAVIKFGYETEEVLGKPARILYADPEEFRRIQHEMDHYGAYAGEVRNVSRDGREFISFLAASRVLEDDGTVLGSMGVSRDVTQSKRDREALLISENKYRDLVDNAYDMIHSVDSEGRFTFVNKAWRRIMGYTDEDLGTMTFYDILVNDRNRARAAEWMKNPWQGANTSPWRVIYRTKEGKEIICEGTSTVSTVNGKPVIARTIMRDITESVLYQRQIEKHAAKERALFDASDHMFWTVDRDLSITSFNKEYADMVERLVGSRPRLNLSGAEVDGLFRPGRRHGFWKEKFDEAFKGRQVKFDDTPSDVHGNAICNEVFLSPVIGPDGRIDEVFGIAREVTLEKENELRVREQGAKLKAIFENSADVLIWGMDQRMDVTACNDAFRKKTGQIIGKPLGEGDRLDGAFRGILDPAMSKVWNQVCASAFMGKRQHRELQLTTKDGDQVWLELYLSPIENVEHVHEISCLALDITDKKRAEKEIIERLEEKEVLLKEVHHRVKNNLQIISSIFNLQKDRLDEDPKCMTLLQQSQTRIRAMSVIHESLYQNKNFNEVDMVRYIQSLCGNLVMTYALNGRIKLLTDLESLELNLDKAVPCGLVLNELISNSLKHAFDGDREGTIWIAMESVGDQVRITVKDDGKGFPAGYDEEVDSGLGTELVQLLMGQLDGEISRTRPESGTGTVYLITFDRI